METEQTYRVWVRGTGPGKVLRTGLSLAAAEKLKYSIEWDTRTAFLLVKIEAEN